MAAAEDYCYWAARKDESIENDNGCISYNDESHKKETEWAVLEEEGKRAFGRDPKAILPERGLVESQYARPGPSQNQGINQLGGYEESGPEEGIWDSSVNMYVASDTDEEEGSHEGEAKIPGEELSHLQSIDQQGDEGDGCIAGSRGHLEADCCEEEALSGTTDSLQVIPVTQGRDQTGTNTIIRVPPRKRAGRVRKEKKTSRFH